MHRLNDGRATQDDVIPLSEPIHTKSGELVDSVTVVKGTLVSIFMESINCSVAIWGEDSKVFRPGRWLKDAHGQNGVPAKAKEIHGHRHLLSFADGPKSCIGKTFALAELKVREQGAGVIIDHELQTRVDCPRRQC